MTRHLLGTPLSDALAAEAEDVAALLRSDAPRDEKIDRVDDLIIRFVQTGIDAHFHGPARLFGLNILLIKVIDIAAATTLRALKTATRRVLKSLSDEQLTGVADELEDRLYHIEVDEE
jgi:hypothetical protein